MIPNTIHLEFIDLFLVALYLVVVVAMGIWLGRGIHTGKDFFLAGKSLPWWAIGCSLVVSDIGAKDMIGLAGDGYRVGMVMMNFDFLGCILPALVAAFLFMPFFWMAGVYTIPEYLGLRYNALVRTAFAIIWTLFMMGVLGTIFVSAAAMFETLLGLNFWVSVSITAIAVALYTTVGGLKAVVFTDALSCVILILGSALICLLGIQKAGGWMEMKSTISALDWTQHHYSLLLPADHPEYSWPAVLLGLGFVLGPAYWIGNQAIVQRGFGAKSQAQARASYLLCAGIKLIFPILLVVPGLIGIALFHQELGSPNSESFDGNRVLPLLVLNLLPPGILGIVLGAFLAGILSNLDSYVNSASTLIVTDLYRPFINPKATDQQALGLGRWLVVLLLLGGALAAYPIKTKFASVFTAFQTFLTFFQGPLLALLLFGMLTRLATPMGGVAALVGGVLSAIILTLYEYHFLWVAWWSFALSIVTLFSVSLITKPLPEERLRGLVCWIPENKNP